MDFSGTNSINMKPIFGGYPFQGLSFLSFPNECFEFTAMNTYFLKCDGRHTNYAFPLYGCRRERYVSWYFYQYSSTIVTQFICLINRTQQDTICFKVWLKYFRMKRSCSLIKIVFLKLGNENKTKTLFKVAEFQVHKL